MCFTLEWLEWKIWSVAAVTVDPSGENKEAATIQTSRWKNAMFDERSLFFLLYGVAALVRHVETNNMSFAGFSFEALAGKLLTN